MLTVSQTHRLQIDKSAILIASTLRHALELTHLCLPKMTQAVSS